MPFKRASIMALIFMLSGLAIPHVAAASSFNPSLSAAAPVVGWTRQFGGNNSLGTNSVEDVIRDAAGDIYVAGYVKGALPGQTAQGMLDAFVRKYSAAGTLVWTSQFGTSADDTITHLALDSSGNVYVGGETDGTISGEVASGGQDVFVRKYSPAGAVLQTEQFGTANTDYSGGIVVDPAGQVYLAGSTFGLFPGNTASGLNDIFVRKMSSGFGPIWTTQFGSNDTDNVKDAALAPNIGFVAGDLYLVGESWGALPLSSLGGSNSWAGSSDMFLARVSSSGGFSVAEFGTTAIDSAEGIAFNPSGDMFVTGYTGGNLTGTPRGGFDPVLIKWLGSNGSWAGWVQWGTASNEFGYSLALDGSSSPYVSGMNAAADATVTKFNSSLAQQWSRQFGTVGTDAGKGIATFGTDRVYVGGSTTGTFSGTTKSGTTDGFLSKLAPDAAAPSAWLSPTPPAFSTSTSKTTTFRVAWTGSDPAPSSGIVAYDLQYKSGANGALQNKPRTSGKSLNFTGAAGSTIYLRVRAIDAAGNTGPYSAFKSTVIPSNEGAATYSAGWYAYYSSTSPCFLSNMKYTSKSGASLSFRFAGSSLSLVVGKGPKKGKAKIYVDGVYKKTIDTYSSSTLCRQVIWIGNYSNPSVWHTLKVVNSATSGRPRVDIDGFAVKR